MSDRLLIYGDSKSGNCYKIQLLCAELDIDYDWREVDILAGDTRTPGFLAMNPNGKIPLARVGAERYLAESNAILSYLADGTALAGADAWLRARVLQWMFFEQYSHEPNIATARFIVRYLGNPPEKRSALEEKRIAGYKALDVMERELTTREFFVNGAFTIADIALYAYTHVAGEGGFDLAGYPAVRRWIGRIESRPRYVAMQAAAA
jgi:glutathione S-transferase